MTLKNELELEALFLIIVATAIGISYATYKNSYNPQFNTASNISPLPVPVGAVGPKTIISSQISPDGKKKVILKITRNQDNTKICDFSVADINNTNEQHIFTKVLNPESSMTIPFNTWSPDDQYFFVRENTGKNINVFVLKATGAEFPTGTAYLNVTDLFKKVDTGNIFGEATGWASDTLIIINTTNKDNSKGPSYWFEVPSSQIIQLSTEF